jgi:hypothetical protein
MLDGLVTQTSGKYSYPLKPIYTKTEKALDVEREVFYYPNCEVHSVVRYYDPRRDKLHANPLRTRVHRVMTQFENFLVTQLTLEELSEKELLVLNNFLEMNPEQVYFDLVVGWYHTEGWREIFKPFGQIEFADDMVYIRRKVKLAKYYIRGVDFKFYRLNPEENRDHALKYPYGWMGLTKCEIPTPILYLDKDDVVLQILIALQEIRQKLVKDKWNQIQFEVGAKTYARSDLLYAWSCNDHNLRGTLKLEETELTKRQMMPGKEYLSLLQAFLQGE